MDCKWSTWGGWSSCSKSCGNGFQDRKRTIAALAKNGGKECLGSSRARKSCTKGKCEGISIHFKQINPYRTTFSSL